MSEHNVGDPGYDANGFRWSGGANKRQSTIQINDKDPQQRCKIIMIRGKALYHKYIGLANIGHEEPRLTSSDDGPWYYMMCSQRVFQTNMVFGLGHSPRSCSHSNGCNSYGHSSKSFYRFNCLICESPNNFLIVGLTKPSTFLHVCASSKHGHRYSGQTSEPINQLQSLIWFFAIMFPCGWWSSCLFSVDVSSSSKLHQDFFRSNISIAISWHSIVVDLLNDIPMFFMSDEMFETLDQVLHDCGLFYEIKPSVGEIDWNFFISLQQVTIVTCIMSCCLLLDETTLNL